MCRAFVRPVTLADHPTLERLWLLFRHDMSEFDAGVAVPEATLPDPDGTFRTERLEAVLSGAVGWAGYLMVSGERPAGFAFVRGLDGPAAIMNSFFVVRGARRSGVGLRAARDVVACHPGPWEIAFQDANGGAVRFWRRVATEIVGDAWQEERRPVPGRPELPADAWISFETRRAD